ncbi:hypothetical protein OE88DRAFT_1653882 [Heliocybe sulcata]|uniref:Uncharacterized protein n=1 Tax=Heliocybe sulcata TaxID=5364 RepID=A0A5C3NCX8_9AGAM|nr:hypothetical protein OE88DRAFT_1653882 [Heliocybe sulcata]
MSLPCHSAEPQLRSTGGYGTIAASRMLHGDPSGRALRCLENPAARKRSERRTSTCQCETSSHILDL